MPIFLFFSDNTWHHPSKILHIPNISPIIFQQIFLYNIPIIFQKIFTHNIHPAFFQNPFHSSPFAPYCTIILPFAPLSISPIPISLQNLVTVHSYLVPVTIYALKCNLLHLAYAILGILLRKTPRGILPVNSNSISYPSKKSPHTLCIFFSNSLYYSIRTNIASRPHNNLPRAVQ